MKNSGKIATEAMEKYLASGEEGDRGRADIWFKQVMVEELRDIGNKLRDISRAIDGLGRKGEFS